MVRIEVRWDMKPENQEPRGKEEGTRELFGSAKQLLVTHIRKLLNDRGATAEPLQAGMYTQGPNAG